MRKKFLILLIIGAAFLLFFIWVFATNVFLNKTSQNATVPKNFNIDYSLLYKLKPGISTKSDVLKIGNVPVSEKETNGKDCFYYDTPSLDYKNTVCLKNNRVDYVLEHIFAQYRGTLVSYQTKYGDADIFYNGNGGDFPWYIYLKQGVAIQATSGQITAMLYFIPQSKQSFYENVGKDVGIAEASPTPQKGIPLEGLPPSSQ